jgi:hypothetical protein
MLRGMMAPAPPAARRVEPEVLKIIHNEGLIFIRFLFR